MKKVFVLSVIFLFSLSAFAGGRSDSLSLESLEKKYPSSEYFMSVGQGSSLSNAQSVAKLGICQSLGESLSGQQQISQASATGREDEGSLSIKVNEAVLFQHITGIQIKETWQPDKTKNDFRAVAVLNKKEAAAYYSRLAKENDSRIQKLISSAVLKSPSFESIALMEEALSAAEDNQYNLDLLRTINQAVYASTVMSYRSVSELKLRKNELASNLTVSVKVEGDKNGAVLAAFYSKLNSMGASVIEGNALYSIKAKLSLEEIKSIDGGKNQYVRYNLSAPAVRASDGVIEKDFSLQGREGQPTKIQAQDRVYVKICSRLNDEF